MRTRDVEAKPDESLHPAPAAGRDRRGERAHRTLQAALESREEAIAALSSAKRDVLVRVLEARIAELEERATGELPAKPADARPTAGPPVPYPSGTRL